MAPGKATRAPAPSGGVSPGFPFNNFSDAIPTVTSLVPGMSGGDDDDDDDENIDFT